jgi:hypothetical protein
VCKYFSLCVVFVIILFCKYLCKKKEKNYFALYVRTHHLRSNVDTELRSNSLAFVRLQRPISQTHHCTYAFDHTLYVRTQTRACIQTHMRQFERSAHFTHTHSARMRSNAPTTFDRMRFWLFLGHYFFLFSPFPLPTVQPSPISLIPLHPISL